MQEIRIENQSVDSLLDELNVILRGTLEEKWGERTLTFDNELGKGIIRSISFDWGVSLIDYDVNFNQDLKLVHITNGDTPVEFIFITEGNLHYIQDIEKESVTLERYQNIIISPKKKSKKTFIFPNRVNVKVNFIQILKKKYAKKKNNNLAYLGDVLSSIFKDDTVSLPFKHLGNYNLEIADYVKQIRSDTNEGMIKTLGIEGRLNVILAMQLLEHHKFENNMTLPESLAREDIKKVQRLAEYMVDNISGPLNIATLSSISGLSAKKLQIGFKVLYGKTVNEYSKTLKLEISRDYLKNTELSISEIVYKIGISSRSYFSKIFHETYGITPTEYRLKLLKRAKI